MNAGGKIAAEMGIVLRAQISLVEDNILGLIPAAGTSWAGLRVFLFLLLLLNCPDLGIFVLSQPTN